MTEFSAPQASAARANPNNTRFAAFAGLFLLAGLVLVVAYYTKIFALLLLAGVLVCVGLAALGRVNGAILLGAGSTLAALLAVETAVLLFNRSYPPADYPPGYWVHSSLVGWTVTPGKHRVVRRTGSGILYDVEYTIDEDGFRLTPPGQVEAKEPTIYFLGCSYTYGEGLNDSETLAHFVKDLRPQFSVKNYGMSGYGPSQNLVTLSDMILERGATVVYQTAPWHAVRSACIPFFQKDAPRFVLGRDGRPVHDGTCDPLMYKAQHLNILRHSRLYQSLLPMLETMQSRRPGVLELYLAIIAEMKRQADARSQRMITAYIKGDEGLMASLGTTNDRVMAAIRGMGIELIDVTLAPTIETLDREYYLGDYDRHPSARANKRRAEILVDYLNKHAQ